MLLPGDAIRTDMFHSQVRLGERTVRTLRDTLQAVVDTSDEAVRERWFAIAARLRPSMRETQFKSLSGALGPLSAAPTFFAFWTSADGT